MALVPHRTQTGLNAAHPPFYVSESDPTTTLGAYRGWFKPSTGEVKIRDGANAAWLDVVVTGTSTALTAHLSDTVDAHDASAISILDTGGDFTATHVEGALAELAAAGGVEGIDDLYDVDISTAPPADGQTLIWDDSSLLWVPGSVAAGTVAAADVTYAGGTGMSATDAEAALDELATEKANASDLTDHIADTSAAHAASAISYAGGTGMSATSAEAAIDELATEKVDTTRTISTTAPLTGGGDLSANRTLAVSAASDTASGVVELATDGETQTGTDTARAITPANLSARSATETRSGIAEIATQAETDTGTDDNRLVTPLKAATRFLAKAGGTLTGFLTLHADPTSALHAVTKQYADGLVAGGASPASETVAGIAEIATQGETDAGTDDARIVTPLKLANFSGLGGSSYRTLVTLGSDVATTSTTAADVTGLSFAVTSGVTYRFHTLIIYTTSGTGNGSAWGISAPASPTLVAWHQRMPSTTSSTGVLGYFTALAIAATTTGSPDIQNVMEMTGIIKPSTSGTFIIRFATESGGTITAKAGSTLEYW